MKQTINHYKTLGIAPNASPEEIKKVYRLLAKKYHPDTGVDAVSAETFKEIAQAFEVLSQKEKRQEHDEKLFYAGAFLGHKKGELYNAHWVRQKIQALWSHVQRVDSTTLNHILLKDYLLFLLSPENVRLIAEDSTEEQKGREFYEKIISKLDYLQLQDLLENLSNTDQLYSKWFPKEELIKYKRRLYLWNKWRVFIIVISSFLLAYVIFLLAGKS